MKQWFALYVFLWCLRHATRNFWQVVNFRYCKASCIGLLLLNILRTTEKGQFKLRNFSRAINVSSNGFIIDRCLYLCSTESGMMIYWIPPDVCLPVRPSICLSVPLSVRPSLCLSIYLSIHMSGDKVSRTFWMNYRFKAFHTWHLHYGVSFHFHVPSINFSLLVAKYFA